jgi:acetate kinase
VTGALLADLGTLEPFAPEHEPAEIALMDACARHYPDVPQVACSDTAFHADLPRVAQLLAIPRRYAERGVRRYGFHGISYTYLMQELARVAGPDAAQGRVLLAHLGNGASMAAVHGGRCVDTTMAFTPAAGLVMGTRSGDLDPGVLVYLVREQGFDAAMLEDLFDHRSGLAGISGLDGDMRGLHAAASASNVDAALAIRMFCYAVRKQLAAMWAVLDGADAIVFTGGIGENAALVREKICSGMESLDVRLDGQRNEQSSKVERRIDAGSGKVAILVIPTDEEGVIAADTYQLATAKQ